MEIELADLKQEVEERVEEAADKAAQEAADEAPKVAAEESGKEAVTNDQSQPDLGMQDATSASGAQPTESHDLVETAPRPDLVWDDEASGLCIRVYGNGSKSFIFVYRFKDQQRFIRIGRSPKWSLDAARIRAKELRSIVDQDRDPEPKVPAPVAELMQYLTEPPTTP